MNIKALVYARYSTSAKIHSVVKEESNRTIAADIEKVALPYNLVTPQDQGPQSKNQ
jgi:hypothetical protein